MPLDLLRADLLWDYLRRPHLWRRHVLRAVHVPAGDLPLWQYLLRRGHV